jgi:hypothetical protein
MAAPTSLFTSKFKNILNCAKELDLLAKTRNPQKRKQLIIHFEDCVINAISEIADNCLKGNIPLKKCQLKKLSKFKETLRKLRKKTKVSTRRKIINQTGGFIGLLLPPALSFIASIIASYLGEKLASK